MEAVAVFRALALIPALSLTATPGFAEVAHRDLSRQPAPALAHERAIPLEGQENFRGPWRVSHRRWSPSGALGCALSLWQPGPLLGRGLLLNPSAPLGHRLRDRAPGWATGRASPSHTGIGGPGSLEILTEAYASPGVRPPCMGRPVQGPDASPAKVREGHDRLLPPMPPSHMPTSISELLPSPGRQQIASAVPIARPARIGTGLASALVLTVLGVPRAKVIEDYVLTEKAGDFRGAAASAPPAAADKDPYAYLRNSKADLIAPLMRADPAGPIWKPRFGRSTRIGSVEAYVRKRLGVSSAELATIRARLLDLSLAWRPAPPPRWRRCRSPCPSWR